MSKVLVVDDEQRYQNHLGRALSRDGHEVRTASSGCHGISVGSRFRPDVLVADWMLSDRVHGLQLSETLRAVVPDLVTILMTGFPSLDLRNEAQRLDVSAFIEKPFELEQICDAVRKARPALTSVGRTPIAVLEVDQSGAITFANQAARELLAQTHAGSSAGTLDQLIGVEGLSQVQAALQRWVTVSPRSETPLAWQLRSKGYPDWGGWLVVVVPEDQSLNTRHPIVRTLLGLESPRAARWPLEGRVLIVDDDEAARRIVATQIEHAGGVCHTADTFETALLTFQRDPGIEVVVLDHDQPKGPLDEFVRQLGAIRPDVRIIASSSRDGSGEFAQVGVTEFLPKPWTVTDLIRLLLDRIGNCVSCGLPLPLRRPQRGEVPDRWVCVGCGGRYSAMLDEKSPSDVLANARPVGIE